jgi:hypothetical protein
LNDGDGVKVGAASGKPTAVFVIGGKEGIRRDSPALMAAPLPSLYVVEE